MRGLTTITAAAILMMATLALGCDNTSQSQVTDTSLRREMELLASEHDLNAMLSRGGEGIVDWQLSREFAQLALEDFISAGDFPTSATLWEIPIAIYDAEGTVRYYEFRVMDGERVVAAIAGNAREDLGGPIARVFPMDGYMDELSQLYLTGELDKDDIPRIVDDDYPSHAVASVSVSRGGSVEFQRVLDPATGEDAGELARVLTAEEMLEQHPELARQLDTAAMEAELAAWREETAQLWSMAKANKGSLGSMAFRGRSRSEPRKSVDESRIRAADNYGISVAKQDRKYRYPIRNGITYLACGSTSAGFLLDFIHGNGLQNLSAWNNLSWSSRVDALESKMGIVTSGVFKGATWPWNLGNAVASYSNYKVTLALGVVPNTCINNNLPGINLRGVSGLSQLTDGLHYRNVVAYDEKGWWIFKWSYIKIHDGNNIDGGWETYNPFYHFFSFNLMHK